MQNKGGSIRMLLLALVAILNYQINPASAGAIAQNVQPEGSEFNNNGLAAAANPAASSTISSPVAVAAADPDFAEFMDNMKKFFQYIQANSVQNSGCANQNIICSILVSNSTSGQGLTAVNFPNPMTVAQCQAACNQSTVTCFAYEITNVTTSVRNVYPVNPNGLPCNCGGSSAVIGGGYTPQADTLLTTTTPPTTTTTPTTTTSSTTTTPTTTTPTTTTPTTTTPTTTTPTTTIPLPTSAYQVAFSAETDSSFSTPGGVVPLNIVTDDYNNHFDVNNDMFTVSAGGIYFTEMCVGVKGGSPVNMRLQGSAPLQLGLTWDATTQDGIVTQCRSGMVQVSSGTHVQMVLDSGVSYSDSNNHLTSLSVFSVSNSMSDNALSALVYAVAPETPPIVNDTLTPIPLTSIIAPSTQGIFNAQKATYTCQYNVPHFVAVSAGVQKGIPTEVQITTSNSINTGLTRTTINYNDITTMSRNVMVSCNKGETITMNLESGTVVNSDGKNNYNLTTFTVFPYMPRSVQTPVAWGIYKWYISYNNQADQSALDPFYFTNVTVNLGNAYNENSRYFVAPVSGYYYTCITSGAGVGVNGNKFDFQMMRNSEVLLTVSDQSTIQKATDIFGQCGVVLLNKGDQVRCVGKPGSYFYSSLSAFELSWTGMLLYQTS